MKKSIFMGILGVFVALVFVSGVMAQEKAATATAAPAHEKAAAKMAAPTQVMKLEKFHGVVRSVDMAKNDVVVQYHKDKMSFSVGEKTKLFEGKKELKFSDLNKGLWASVEYQKEGNQLLAQSIHVSPVKLAKNMASSKGMTEKKMTTPEKTTQTK
jgi:Cu/Ag efflux protein CusF